MKKILMTIMIINGFFLNAHAFYDFNFDINSYAKYIQGSGLKKVIEHWKFETAVSQDVFLAHLNQQTAGVTILSESPELKNTLKTISNLLKTDSKVIVVKSFGCASIRRMLACEIIYLSFGLNQVEPIGRAFGFIDFSSRKVIDLKLEFKKVWP